MHEFNQSLKYDKRMHAADIKGSIAYAKSLKLIGILTQDETTTITDGLQAVEEEWASGSVSTMLCFSEFESNALLVYPSTR